MLELRSPFSSRGCLNASSLTLLAVLTTSCSDDTAVPPLSAALDAALDVTVAVQDAAAASSVTDLFGGNPVPTAQTVASSAPSYDETHAAAPIQACEDAVGGGGAPLIDDFEDGNTATLEDDGRAGTWYFYDDLTQGERNDAVDVDPLGERSGNVLAVTGSGFSDWGSGFGAGMRWNTGQCTYDASFYDGVEFWIRGTGTTRVTLQNLSVRPVDVGGECPTDAACFDSHGVDLTLNDAWTLVHLPFSAFEQAGWGTPVGPLRTNAIYLLEFQFGAIAPYSVWLDDVTFFRDTEATDAGANDASTTNDATAADAFNDASTPHDAFNDASTPHDAFNDGSATYDTSHTTESPTDTSTTSDALDEGAIRDAAATR